MTGNHDRSRKKPPRPSRDETEEFDLSFEEVFDRTTVSPEGPPDDYAAELMRQTPSANPEEDDRTPISLPPAPSKQPAPRRQTFGTDQQDTTGAISVRALEFPPLSERSHSGGGDSGGVLELGNDLLTSLDSGPPPDPASPPLGSSGLSARDLVRVPALPRNPPPATRDLDPMYAGRAPTSRHEGRRKDETESLGNHSLEPAALEGQFGDMDSDIPAALGGGRRVKLSEPLPSSMPPPPSSGVPSVLGRGTGALAFVDRHSHPPGNIAQAQPNQEPTPQRMPSKASPAEATPKRLRERYALGDFTGALSVAEALLEMDPKNAEAQKFAGSCREVLMQMYVAKLSPLDQRPRVAIANDQIRWLSLDHRAGFLLSLIDGQCSLDELLDVSGMARLDSLRILSELLEQKVISLK